MYPLVYLQVVITGDCLSTLVTNNFCTGVYLLMCFDSIFPKARVVAHVTGVLFGSTLGIVNGSMEVETPLIRVTRLAHLANVRLFPGVTDDVPFEYVLRGETLVAQVAPNLVVVNVVSLVLFDVVHACSRELTVSTLIRAVFMLTLDVIFAAVFGAEELLTGFTAVGYSVFATTRMIVGHVNHAEFDGGENLVALAALVESLERA